MIKFNLFSTFFFVSLACLPHWIWVCFLISFGLLDRRPQVCRKPDWDTTHLTHDVETQQTQVHSITRWSKAKRRGRSFWSFSPFSKLLRTCDPVPGYSDWIRPSHPKTLEQQQRLLTALERCPLFRGIDVEVPLAKFINRKTLPGLKMECWESTSRPVNWQFRIKTVLMGCAESINHHCPSMASRFLSFRGGSLPRIIRTCTTWSMLWKLFAACFACIKTVRCSQRGCLELATWHRFHPKPLPRYQCWTVHLHQGWRWEETCCRQLEADWIRTNQYEYTTSIVSFMFFNYLFLLTSRLISTVMT